jgi:1,4-alpha-glucan branching enzyme
VKGQDVWSPGAPQEGEARSALTEQDMFLFNEGTHYRLFDKLGAHRAVRQGTPGIRFAVWAPNAKAVSVVGDFNGWNTASDRLEPRGQSGIWEGFIPGLARGAVYKYHIVSHHDGYEVQKADPFAVHCETPPKTASVVWDLDYEWDDGDWMGSRGARHAGSAPISIYEVHLGSWKRHTLDGNRPYSYRELADDLPAYVQEMGFTHVEFMPVMEHPFYGSWGYQTTGHFAPTSRYGTPQDFMYLIDRLHQHGIGVFLDWVPSHFPSDEHGLAYFDGTHLFEHSDPRQGFHPDWESIIYNYGRKEVPAFLISSAVYWLEKFHVDGLRVDAVASMLYLDYSREEGEWIPNEYGGRENLEAIDFLRRLNTEIYRSFPDVQMIAEESTDWPMVSRPTYVGGLGFGMKWDMGWMHDTLKYMRYDAVHRKFHHNELTFRMLYAHTENFALALSHDEVVHGKGSLLAKMPGDDWQRFANLRALYGYMFAQPGKKLLFMGDELAAYSEWYHEAELDWSLLQYPRHAGVQRWLRDLNRFYRDEPAMHELDFDARGFEWIDGSDSDNSTLSFLRRGSSGATTVLAVCNFTPVTRKGYRVGVPHPGRWDEALNSDAHDYGGSGTGNSGGVEAAPVEHHGRPCSLELTLPPLSVVFFVNRR